MLWNSVDPSKRQARPQPCSSIRQVSACLCGRKQLSFSTLPSSHNLTLASQEHMQDHHGCLFPSCTCGNLNACTACWPVTGLKIFQTLRLFVPLATSSLPPHRQNFSSFCPCRWALPLQEGPHRGCHLGQGRGLGGFPWPCGMGYSQELELPFARIPHPHDC